MFVYVSDLAPIMAGITRVLSPQGLLAFTVETHSGDGVKLLPTLRYAHGEPYVRRLLAKAGLALASIAKAAVRSEKAVPVESLVVVAQPSTASLHELVLKRDRSERAAVLPDVFARWFASRGWVPRAHQLELLARRRRTARCS